MSIFSVFVKDKELRKELSKLRKGIVATRLSILDLRMSTTRLNNKWKKTSIFITFFIFLSFFLTKLYIFIQANISWILAVIKINAAQVGTTIATTSILTATTGTVYKAGPIVVEQIIQQIEKIKTAQMEEINKEAEKEIKEITKEEGKKEESILVAVPQKQKEIVVEEIKKEEVKPIQNVNTPQEVSVNNAVTLINSSCKIILIDGTEINGRITSIDDKGFKILKNNGQIEYQDPSFIFKIMKN